MTRNDGRYGFVRRMESKGRLARVSEGLRGLFRLRQRPKLRKHVYMPQPIRGGYPPSQHPHFHSFTIPNLFRPFIKRHPSINLPSSPCGLFIALIYICSILYYIHKRIETYREVLTAAWLQKQFPRLREKAKDKFQFIISFQHFHRRQRLANVI